MIASISSQTPKIANSAAAPYLMACSGSRLPSIRPIMMARASAATMPESKVSPASH
jgi:hypothetical protein